MEEASILQTTDAEDAFVNLNGHDHYIKSRKSTGIDSQTNSIGPLSILGYFNCGDLGQMLKDCTQPLNLANVAA